MGAVVMGAVVMGAVVMGAVVNGGCCRCQEQGGCSVVKDGCYSMCCFLHNTVTAQLFSLPVCMRVWVGVCLHACVCACVSDAYASSYAGLCKDMGRSIRDATAPLCGRLV